MIIIYKEKISFVSKNLSIVAKIVYNIYKQIKISLCVSKFLAAKICFCSKKTATKLLRDYVLIKSTF